MAVVGGLALAEGRSPVVNLVPAAGSAGLVGLSVSVPWARLLVGGHVRWLSLLSLDGAKAVRLIGS